jgi:hypothetical protein
LLVLAISRLAAGGRLGVVAESTRFKVLKVLKMLKVLNF